MELRSKIPVWIIIITILLFLFVLVFIANKAVVYDKPLETKNLSYNNAVFKNITPLRYFKSQDAIIFNLDKLDDDNLIFLTGDFDEASLTVWNKNKRVYNKILNSAYGVVFYKNKNLISQGFYNIPYIYEGENVLKNIAVEVKTFGSEVLESFVSVNNYRKAKIFIYNPKTHTKSSVLDDSQKLEDVNIEIEPILKDYDYSEYGVTNYIKSYVEYANLKKIIPDRTQVHWYYNLQAYKKYLFVYYKSRYNLLIKHNDVNIRSSSEKTDPHDEELVMLEFNPHNDSLITIQNLDEKIEEKNINSDFVDAIYAPYYAYEQFVYGKKQKVITAKNRINFKVFLYEI
jgi:hypothetical protein